jgi:hypothetical protein
LIALRQSSGVVIFEELGVGDVADERFVLAARKRHAEDAREREERSASQAEHRRRKYASYRRRRRRTSIREHPQSGGLDGSTYRRRSVEATIIVVL